MSVDKFRALLHRSEYRKNDKNFFPRWAVRLPISDFRLPIEGMSRRSLRCEALRPGTRDARRLTGVIEPDVLQELPAAEGTGFRAGRLDRAVPQALRRGRR